MKSLSLAAPFRTVRFLFISLRDFIFPPVCFGCGAREAPDALVCQDCLNALYRYSLPTHGGSKSVVTHLRSLGNYVPPFSSLVHELKYRNRTRLAPLLGDALTSLLMTDSVLKQADLLAPIPLHPARLRERGYNQSELLARRVAQLTGIPVTSVLRRVKNTKTQARIMDAKKRRDNLKGAFAVTDTEALKDKQVLLIDDVTTTGATLDVAARAVLDAGARRVCALVVAQAGNN